MSHRERYGLVWVTPGGNRCLPIVHSAIDFLRPITWGDRLDIQLYPELENSRQFKISYRIFKENQDSPQNRPWPQPLPATWRSILELVSVVAYLR